VALTFPQAIFILLDLRHHFFYQLIPLKREALPTLAMLAHTAELAVQLDQGLRTVLQLVMDLVVAVNMATDILDKQ
jgi:hypothetical protein